MNLQQQREAVRRRRLVTRGVQQMRQRHLDEVRLGVVASQFAHRSAHHVMQPDPSVQLELPAVTLAVKAMIVLTMAALLLQFHAPLADAALSVLASVVS